MHRVAITVSALGLAAALAGACSNSSDSEKLPALDEGAGGSGGRADGGGGPFDDAGEDVDEDGGITDARDELVPIDASRGGDSGDADSSDGGEEADVLPEPECVFDEDCSDKITFGMCERPICKEQRCTKAPAKIGTLCDDGEVCTEGDSCDGDGVCVAGLLDVRNESCVVKPTPNSLWFTEIMGAPVPIENVVATEDGQWIEVTVRGPKAVSLERATLGYYEWDEHEAEPQSPELTIARLQGIILPTEPQLFVRSNDPYANGNLLGAVEYANVAFSNTRNARLLLIGPEWRPAPDEAFMIPTEHVIDSVLIPAGTFGDASQGRSWQASMPLPDPSKPGARIFCHTPAEASNAYVAEDELKNYGTPGSTNVGCGP